MTCHSHHWMFTIPCPRCAVAGVSNVGVTDAERRAVICRVASDCVDGARAVSSVVGGVQDKTLQTEPYVEPPLPVETGDVWEIPAYLLRRPGGGFKYPSLHGDKRASQPVDDGMPTGPNRSGVELGSPTRLKFWSDQQLLTALSDDTISRIDRQPILEEAKKRHDQVKGYERKKAFL